MSVLIAAEFLAVSVLKPCIWDFTKVTDNAWTFVRATQPMIMPVKPTAIPIAPITIAISPWILCFIYFFTDKKINSYSGRMTALFRWKLNFLCRWNLVNSVLKSRSTLRWCGICPQNPNWCHSRIPGFHWGKDNRLLFQPFRWKVRRARWDYVRGRHVIQR